MRQVLKTVYNIDINNLPIVETSHEQKRKLKKKLLTQQPNNFSPSHAPVAQAPNTTTTTSGSNLQQAAPINGPIVAKSRARTEIYPPSYYPSSLPSNSANTTHGALNLHTVQQPGTFNNVSGNTVTALPATSISTSTTVNNSASSSNTASPVQPLLTRQRKLLVPPRLRSTIWLTSEQKHPQFVTKPDLCSSVNENTEHVSRRHVFAHSRYRIF